MWKTSDGLSQAGNPLTSLSVITKYGIADIQINEENAHLIRKHFGESKIKKQPEWDVDAKNRYYIKYPGVKFLFRAVNKKYFLSEIEVDSTNFKTPEGITVGQEEKLILQKLGDPDESYSGEKDKKLFYNNNVHSNSLVFYLEKKGTEFVIRTINVCQCTLRPKQ